MKILKSAIYLIIVLLSSCNLTDDINNQGINIQLNLPSRSTTSIKSISLEIDAPDMETIKASTTGTSGAVITDTNTINVEVPTGEDRTFSIVVTLDDDSTLSGSTTTDIKSSTSTISVKIDYDILSLTLLVYMDNSPDYTINLADSDGDTNPTFYIGYDEQGVTTYKITAQILEDNYETATYEWLIDGEAQAVAYPESIDIDASYYSVGTHELTLFVTIDGSLYSKSIYFVIESSSEYIEEPY